MTIENLSGSERALAANWLDAHGESAMSVLRAGKAFRPGEGAGTNLGVFLVARSWFTFISDDHSFTWSVKPGVRGFYLARIGMLKVVDFVEERVDRLLMDPPVGQAVDDILCRIVADHQITLDRRWLQGGAEEMLAHYVSHLRPDESVMGAELGTSSAFGGRFRNGGFFAYTGRRLSAFSEKTAHAWEVSWSDVLELSLGRPRRHSERVRVVTRAGDVHEFECRNDFAARLALEQLERSSPGWESAP